MENSKFKDRRNDDNRIEEIKERLTSIEVDVKILINNLDSLHQKKNEAHDRIELLLEKHNKTLYGNGTVGLTTKADALKNLEEDFKNHSLVDRNAFIGIFTILVTIILGIGKLVFFK